MERSAAIVPSNAALFILWRHRTEYGLDPAEFAGLTFDDTFDIFYFIYGKSKLN